jgi:hypothetical protein
MKKVCGLAIVALAVLAWFGQSAQALPPINVQWHEKYSSLKDAVVAAYGEETTAKCNVCHVAGKSKKEKNAYGAAVGKFITKAGVNKIKEDAGDNVEKANADTKAYILEGLAKAEGEKAASGKSYGELIKSGKLPGAE